MFKSGMMVTTTTTGSSVAGSGIDFASSALTPASTATTIAGNNEEASSSTPGGGFGMNMNLMWPNLSVSSLGVPVGVNVMGNSNSGLNLNAVDGMGMGENGNSRLARNRRTARMRRERKKKEAENLTSNLTEELSRQKMLKEQFKSLPMGIQKEYEEFEKNVMKKFIKSGCLFCNQIIVSNCDEDASVKKTVDKIVKHYNTEHPHDLKASQGYLGNDIFDLVQDPKKLLDHVEDLCKENCQKGTPTSTGGQVSYGYARSVSDEEGDSTLIHRRLSLAEKKKRRLERNAESARLCRQRKKLYIQKIRLQLPNILQNNAILSEFLALHQKDVKQTSKEILEKSESLTTVENNDEDEENDKETLPKMTGWDHGSKRPKMKRSLSSSYDATSSKKQMLESEVFSSRIPQFLPNAGLNLSLNGFDLSRLLSTNAASTAMKNWAELMQLNNLLLQSTINVNNALQIHQVNSAASQLQSQLQSCNLTDVMNLLKKEESRPMSQSFNSNANGRDVLEAAFALTRLGSP